MGDHPPADMSSGPKHDETESGTSFPVMASIPTAADSPPELNAPQPPKHSHWKNSKKFIAAAVILLLAALAAGIFWKLHSPIAPEPVPVTKISVRLAWLHGAQFAGMYVAKDKGYYKAVGLDVDLKEEVGEDDINKEVDSGEVDFGVSTPLEVILARNAGKKTIAIAAVTQVSPYAIAAKKESHITTPADFKGKVLGSLGGNNEAKVTYAALLATAALKPTDATVKSVDFDAVKVFRDHEADTADIYRTDQTFLLDQAHIAYTLIYPEQYGQDSYGDILIAKENKISANPSQVQAFVSATMKGWQYAIDHQDETVATLAKYENEAYKIAGYEKFVLAATAPLIRPTGKQKFGAMDFTIWNRIYLTADAAGLITTPMEVHDFYTSQFVQ